MMRQIGVRWVTAQTELQNFHSRQIEIVAQSFYVRSNDAQIFGKHRQFIKVFLQGLEQFTTGHFDPFAISRSLILGWNFPACSKASEMVYAHKIYEL